MLWPLRTCDGESHAVYMLLPIFSEQLARRFPLIAHALAHSDAVNTICIVSAEYSSFVISSHVASIASIICTILQGARLLFRCPPHEHCHGIRSMVPLKLLHQPAPIFIWALPVAPELFRHRRSYPEVDPASIDNRSNDVVVNACSRTWTVARNLWMKIVRQLWNMAPPT